MSEGRHHGQILLACVTEHDWERPSPRLASLVAGADLWPVVRRAAYHGVENFVYLSLRALAPEVGVDREVLAELERRYTAGLRHQLRVLADLAFVVSRLEAAGIPALVFKGPVLSGTVYGRADLRSYHDLDVLVPRGGFAKAVEALEAAGSTLLDKNWELLRQMELGQLHLLLRHGTLADLHWHLVNRRSIRRSLAVPTDQLFGRARTLQLSGTTVRTFDPADTVVHLCLHAALAGGIRLLWLKDIERTVARDGVEWDQVVDRARAWHAAVPVAAMLRRSRRALGASVPDAVISELEPSRLGRAADAAFDLLWPPQAVVGDHAPSALWMRYRRDSPRTTASLVASRLRSRWPARASAPATGGGDDWTDVLPVFQPTGGPESRAAFFTRITSSSTEGETSEGHHEGPGGSIAHKT